jgi:penicillin-binding protein 1C
VNVAFKTGTSIGFKDCWSVAIFDRYILAVWLGNFDGQGNSAFQGRTMATPLLFRVVDSILAGIPESARLPDAQPPEGVSRVAVCAVSGAIPGPDCPETVDAWFIPGASPIATCRIHRRINLDTRTGWRTDAPAGGPIVSEVREFWPSDLLESFASAGLPRLSPPPYPPSGGGASARDKRGEGFPPAILSPLANTTYVLRPLDDKRRSLVLTAAADADSGEVFWFADARFIGRAPPGDRLLWQPDSGSHVITAVDGKGRSRSIRISVTVGE